MKQAHISPRSLPVREFFLARQPILNRKQGLVAYELLFRNAASGPARITSDLNATASVIAHAAQLGIDKVIGDAAGFLNVEAAVLMSDIFAFLPREKVVLEVLEATQLTQNLAHRIAELAQQGFRFALHDATVRKQDIAALLPYVDILKINLQDVPYAELAGHTAPFSLLGKKLLAEKVEEKQQYETCLELGFDYFQGYYFARPVILSGKKLSPTQVAILDLMRMINAEVDSAEIEEAIKRDVSLCFNLLRLVNTPAFGMRRSVDTIAQAMLVLGRSQLQRWLQIMLYSEGGQKEQHTAPLLSLAATRGKLLELVALQLKPGNTTFGDTAFTLGIMSLIDALFGIPMDEILDQLAVSDRVRLALLYRGGLYGDLLKLAEYVERLDEADENLCTLLDRLQLESAVLREIQLAAFEWSDQLTRVTQ